MRRTTILLATACLALAGCSSGGEPEKEPVTVTATPTPTATPSLSQAETMRQCSVAVSEEAPGWEDWNYNPGEWQDDPRTPPACLGLVDEEIPSRGNRAFMEALIEGLEMADDPRARS
ncbi:hypothetical protein OG252_13175 [Streptomyces sp. NBC_01352]|uniref:hypothetical protein n=1 Tax=Streptomyces sp. NBC_01352 TaxID=2903834 RepID=UPI002E316BB6|nr:hypothetical protein [Streptomyces sp. NBC_01352]